MFDQSCFIERKLSGMLTQSCLENDVQHACYLSKEPSSNTSVHNVGVLLFLIRGIYEKAKF